jgi:anti-anti-sigma factor
VTEQGTTTTIAVDGEWDLTELQASRAAIGAVFEGRPECIVLDLSRLSFIDSTGLHVVVELHKRCAHQSVRLAIVRGPRAVQRIFEICKLTELLPFIERRAVT